jgi:hypothetical protein
MELAGFQQQFQVAGGRRESNLAGHARDRRQRELEAGGRASSRVAVLEFAHGSITSN